MHFSYGNVCLKLCLYNMHLPQTLSSSPFAKGSELTWQTSMLHSYTVLLMKLYICMGICLFQDSCQSFYGLGWLTWCQDYLKMHLVGEGPGAVLWVLRHFLSLISRQLLLLLLSHFSCVRLCVTPQTAAHQAAPSLGFSRQEHRSGLPFPSPMHLVAIYTSS